MVLFTAISCGHQKQNFIFWREFFENSFERKNQLLLVITFWINHFLNSNMKSHIQEWFCLLLFRLPMQPQPIVKPIRLGNYVNKNREKRIFWLKIPPFFNCQDYWKPNWKRTKRRRMEGHTSVYWTYGRGIWKHFPSSLKTLCSRSQSRKWKSAIVMNRSKSKNQLTFCQSK